MVKIHMKIRKFSQNFPPTKFKGLIRESLPGPNEQNEQDKLDANLINIGGAKDDDLLNFENWTNLLSRCAHYKLKSLLSSLCSSSSSSIIY